MINIKGYDFYVKPVRDSYDRRALQYKNKIVNSLKVFGLTVDDIDVPMESVAMRKAQASVSWYMWNEHFLFSYNGAPKFVENLAMVFQVIDHFIYLLCEEKITQKEFLETFVEDNDILEQRKDARELLGIEEHSVDFDLMHQNYKNLAKAHHPDMPDGSTEKFKAINKAHKVLKSELC